MKKELYQSWSKLLANGNVELKVASYCLASILLASAAGCPAHTHVASSATGGLEQRSGISAPDASQAAPKPSSREGPLPTFCKAPQWKLQHFIPLPQVPEPSGLCYVPEQDVMYVVDDGDSKTRRPSRLVKLDLNCKALKSMDLGVDLEGVCWCGYWQRLIVADEHAEEFYIVDPVAWRQTGSFQLARQLNGKTIMRPGGNGIEGVEYQPAASASQAGRLLALNQDDPTGIAVIAIARLNPDENDQHIAAERMVVLDQINAGELRYFPATNELWVVHSWLNSIEALDPDSLKLLRWEVLPGNAQEGIAFDAQGRLWVAQDTGGIGIYIQSL